MSCDGEQRSRSFSRVVLNYQRFYLSARDCDGAKQSPGPNSVVL